MKPRTSSSAPRRRARTRTLALSAFIALALDVRALAFASDASISNTAAIANENTRGDERDHDDDLKRRIARLDRDDPADESGIANAIARGSADDEMRALAVAGEAAALAALDDFARAPVLGRRRRAWIVREAGGAACIAGAIEHFSDPDALTRGTLVEFLGRMELLQSALDARITALAERARADGESSVRLAAASSLASIGEPAAVERLDRLLDELPDPERAHAARLLAQSPRAESVVSRRVLDACAAADRDRAPNSATDARAASPAPAGVATAPSAEALASLIAAYGRCVADATSGGETRAERAPFVLFARHPDPRLKAAAAVAFDTLLRRLSLRGDEKRIALILRGLAEQGFDPRIATYQRARLALTVGDDPHAAIEDARELARIAAADDGRDARVWTARALALEACAWIAADGLEQARAPIARAERILDDLIGDRADLQGKALAGDHVQCLHERALCELVSAVRRIAVECPPDPTQRAETTDAKRAPESKMPTQREISPEISIDAQREIAMSLQHMHALEIEAQLAAWRGELGANGSLDPLLEAEQSPIALVLENPRVKNWSASRALRVRELLGRGLKTVAPSEVPGFEPFHLGDASGGAVGAADLPPEVVDPLKDPERRGLLVRLQYARLDALSKELNELFERLARRGVTDTAQLSGAEERRIRELRFEMDRTVASVQGGEKNGWRELAELRVPAWYALNLARELRNDGQPARARAVAAAMRADLDAEGSAQKYLWGLELEAELEMTTGTSYTDDGDPKQAEVELVKAVERLEALEKLVREREFGLAPILRLQSLRCGALVSLAVNANVKQGDTEKAVGYFERAWALRQDDSMRVLLACYRARQGRAAEARTLLRSVTPTPLVHYNMACTWALLGEKDLALEFLRREFQEGQLSPGGAAKQREWARSDPDLKSLRDDVRFQAIVGK